MYHAPKRYVADLPTPPRCLVMGVVNVTPDSFSDGGLWLEPDEAVQHGHDLLAAGADLVDVGGESTRPGARRPSVEEELARILPVVTRLSQSGALVSIDTMRAEVARQALCAGAVAVNDVSGGLADDAMLSLVGEADVPYICMHWRAHSASMQQAAQYDDVVTDVIDELQARVEAALAAGVRPEHLVIDPGLGFAKTGAHNWQILRRLTEFHRLGFPLLVAASRKTFLGALLADGDGTPRPAGQRDDATTALSALAALDGVWCVRVHDVARSLDAVRVAARYAQDPTR